MSEKIRFVANEPFGKYEFARFVCGIYDATEEEAEQLRKSVYYGNNFRELEPIKEEPEETVEEKVEEEKKVLDFDTKKFVNYNELKWPELQKFASSIEVNPRGKKKDVLLKEIAEKLEKDNGDTC